MQILLKLSLLLINIDQETVLNFFGIEDPNNSQLLDLSYPILNQTAVSTEISFETLRLVFQGLLERYQNGLGLVDIENLVLFLIFIRFIILSIRYNIKTSFYICCIGLFAAGLWYFHLKDLFLWYRDMMLWNRFTSQFAEDSRTNEIITNYTQSGNLITEKEFNNPINFIKYSLVEGSKRDGYRIDPISMIFARMPESIKIKTDQFYYSIFGGILPTTWKFLTQQVFEYLPLIMYLVVVRLNKKYCPYLIRWHWTLIMMFSIIESILLKFVQRLQYYWFIVLVPEERYREEELIMGILIAIVILHFLFVLFGLLHAACGQYFYFPFLVENAEIHIGPRPLNSIYSGGYTAWQNNEAQRIKWIAMKTKGSWQLYFPRLWWGWFGRGVSNLDNKFIYQEGQYRGKRMKKFRNKRKQGIKKFFKKLRKWIKK
jgi:hypothetical protein